MKVIEQPSSYSPPDWCDVVGPVACMDCGFEGDIPQKWYKIHPPITSGKVKNEVEKILRERKEKYCILDTEVWQNGTLASVSWCPECGSENLEEGF